MEISSKFMNYSGYVIGGNIFFEVQKEHGFKFTHRISLCTRNQVLIWDEHIELQTRMVRKRFDDAADGKMLRGYGNLCHERRLSSVRF